jgi:UDP-N-acetyl-D-mannosaminuronic acid transferase (WecB/TagA/CpsF family)
MKLDDKTLELPGLKKTAMTNAERSKAKRERLAAEGKKQISVTVSLEVIEAIRKHTEFKDMTLGEAAEKALRGYFLRKR